MNDNVPICTFCAATVKPDVVFFGEDLPQKYFLHTQDFPKTDLLIIMGTSLQVNFVVVFVSEPVNDYLSEQTFTVSD